VISDYSKRIVLGEMDFDSVLGALVDHSAFYESGSQESR